MRARLFSSALFLCAVCSPQVGAAQAAPQKPHDIIFIVMDDVGIDEMTVFGWGNPPGSPLPPPKLPNIDAIALSGVRFANTWVMPECSPSRISFFTGRYPMRTGVTSALIDNMFPTSQSSPYETTIPRVLATKGYSSALIGKFHLGIANPNGLCSPAVLGWNYFDGYTGASPGAIDKTAGNGNAGAEVGPYVCGFDQSGNGGACYQTDGSCARADNGKACLDSGGLFHVGEQCQHPAPADLDFSRLNSYYVWPRVVNTHALPQDQPPNTCDVNPVTVRQHQTPVQGDTAVDWWTSQKGPRMLTLAYSVEHTPFQQPPGGTADTNKLQCQAESGTPIPLANQWLIANAMLAGMDSDIGKVLERLGLARLDGNGVIETTVDADGNRHIPELEKSGTMVVIIGDNGQFGPLVESPFSKARAKGTVYQTGVWVPLIVAGSLVHSPGRIDNHMINGVDLFNLFGEFAGLDVNKVVAPAHALDGHPMLVHLTEANHGETRTNNFTQLGPGTFEVPTNPKTRSWPCVLAGTITQSGGHNSGIRGGTCVDVLFSTRAFCEQENGGVWFGPPDDTDQNPLQLPNPDSPDGSWSACCEVRKLNPQGELDAVTQFVPVNQWAERDAKYKYVERESTDCKKPLCPGPECHLVFPPYGREKAVEFYDIQPSITNPAGLDEDKYNLACAADSGKDPISCVPPALRPEFLALQSALYQQLNSEVSCPGDGNLDKRVNTFDLLGVQQHLDGPPSIWDFNNHATTDEANLQTVTENLGKDCLGLCARADLNRDGVVDARDLKILLNSLGKPCELCGPDLNGDGKVNTIDAVLMAKAIASCKHQDHTGTTTASAKGKQ